MLVQLGPLREARLACTLRLEAGQIACWALEAGNDLLLDEGIERGVNRFCCVQHRFLARPGDDDQVADIRSADVRAQHCIERLVRRGHRAQGRQLVVPNRSAMCVEGNRSEDGYDQEQGARRPHPLKSRGERHSQGCDVTDIQLGWAEDWGSTYRVTRAAARRPLMENSPSCASPGKPDGSRDAKPTMEVSTPNRMVGQRVEVRCCD